MSYFGNVKAFNLKKIKIIAEPVAAMAGGGHGDQATAAAPQLGKGTACPRTPGRPGPATVTSGQRRSVAHARSRVTVTPAACSDDRGRDHRVAAAVPAVTGGPGSARFQS